MKLFIDTNAFIALYDVKDPTHKKAHELLNKIPDDWNLKTSSDVIGETLTVVSMKLGKSRVNELYNEILSGIDTIMLDLESFNLALDKFKSLKSKNISFIDCTSFVLCEKHKFDAVFTFDKHFKQQGIKLLGDVV